MNERAAGILMPISSLPSEYGIGCFSKSAYEFVDWLKEAGQSYWQILPLGPTSYGDSPYQSFSTFAGNPYFIDLLTLLLTSSIVVLLISIMDNNLAVVGISAMLIVDFVAKTADSFNSFVTTSASSEQEKNAQANAALKINFFIFIDY